jgi:glycosyl transferase family 25
MIPVYIINLARRPDRLERLGGHLTSMGIAWERVEAVDALQVSERELAAVALPSGPLGKIGKGDRACTLSHMRAWETLLASDAPYALVLEDDAYLSPEARDAVSSADWIPPGVEVVKLEKYGDGPSNVLIGPAIGTLPGGKRKLHRMYSRHVGGAAYIISRKAAENALRLKGRIRVPVDHLLFNGNVSPLFRRFKPALIRPAIATQRQYGYDSDISAFGKALKPKGWALFRRKLKRGFYETRLIPKQIWLVLIGKARLQPITWQETLSPES